MSQSLERILRFLTNKENLEEVSVSDLQKLTDESPFFPVAQLLLAKKLKAGSHSDFVQQSQKASLYFSNPFWLHFQLEGKSAEVLADNDDFNIESKITDKQDAAANEEKPVETEKINLAEKEFDTEKNADQPEEEMAAITREPDVTTELFLNEAVSAEETSDINDNDGNLPKTDNSSALEDAEVVEELPEASKETDGFPEIFSEDEQTALPENVESSTPADNNLFDGNLSKDNKETAEQDEHEKMFQNIKAMLDATSEEADADTNNAAIPIDPYYTIDYFAAQGIKLELDPNPKDELGKHLKKFTQWLKQMKKLGPEDATEVISRRETEADIQKIADSSNTAREVVTEAMASVLEKQGKKEKAIELYNKLSFLNPDKSAYFAVKIKNLKGS